MSQEKKKAAPDEAAEEKRLAIIGDIKAFDLPPLEEGTDAYAALEASLLQHGSFNPVVMHGDEVISGRARKAICDKHGIKYQIIKVDDWDEADLVSLTNDLNFCGRQIDNATKKAFAKELLVATKGRLSNRAIGSMACLDAKTVQTVRDSLESSEEIPHTVRRCSRDGRSQDTSDKAERKGEPKTIGNGKGTDDTKEHEEPEGEQEDKEKVSLPLVKVDSFDVPETRPDYVYEANKEKGTITRRKVEKQKGDKYYLGDGKSLLKKYGHPTWHGAQESLVLALQAEKDETEEEIEDLTEQKKKLEAQIIGANKEKEKLAERIQKVEQLVPPKYAAAETEDEAA